MTRPRRGQCRGLAHSQAETRGCCPPPGAWLIGDSERPDTNLTPTAEQEQIRDTVATVADEERQPCAAGIDETDEFPRDLVDQMADLGLMWIPVPEVVDEGDSPEHSRRPVARRLTVLPGRVYHKNKIRRPTGNHKTASRMTGNETVDAGDGSALDAHLGDVLDATDTVVWEADLGAQTIEYVGPAEEVLGLQPATFSDPVEFNRRLVHPDDRVSVAERFGTLLDGDEEAIDSEFRTNPENGPVRWVRTQASTETRRDGTPATLVGLSTDITPLKEREARLDEFAGVVSHDLRNPLSVAKARVELGADETGSEHLDHALDALDRMEALIGNLLALAREDRALGNLEPVALDSVVNGAWDTVDTADASLTVETDRTVRADRTRLRQLFENVVRNAVEHGGPDVTVRVGVLPDESGFYVEDDGVGIPPEDREALVASGPATGRHRGLGLRIVTQVVEDHGWSIHLTGSNGGGARFELSGVDFI